MTHDVAEVSRDRGSSCMRLIRLRNASSPGNKANKSHLRLSSRIGTRFQFLRAVRSPAHNPSDATPKFRNTYRRYTMTDHISADLIWEITRMFTHAFDGFTRVETLIFDLRLAERLSGEEDTGWWCPVLAGPPQPEEQALAEGVLSLRN